MERLNDASTRREVRGKRLVSGGRKEDNESIKSKHLTGITSKLKD